MLGRLLEWIRRYREELRRSREELRRAFVVDRGSTPGKR
jgi:hypothetical protein